MLPSHLRSVLRSVLHSALHPVLPGVFGPAPPSPSSLSSRNLPISLLSTPTTLSSRRAAALRNPGAASLCMVLFVFVAVGCSAEEGSEGTPSAEVGAAGEGQAGESQAGEPGEAREGQAGEAGAGGAGEASGETGRRGAASADSHEDLVAFFREWREFQQPEMVEGVPDYSPRAMARQHRELDRYRTRLERMDTTGWSVAHQIDHHLIRAEMNGLDFDHRVLRPWARMPSFYTMIHAAQSDVPAHEGPFVHGWIDTWTYDYPLSRDDAAELADRIGTIPALLEQARGNLTGDARDLWMAGIRAMEGQVSDLESFGARVEGTSTELDDAVAAAIQETEEFRNWLEEEAPSKTGPSGVGEENYDWYLKHVHLVPYAWEDVVRVMQRELARSHATLRLEEERNRDLPAQTRISSPEEYDRRLNAAVDRYVAFLRENDLLTMRDYMAPALRERIGSFRTVDSPDELRGFFSEVSYRDPLTMRTHGHHWFDLAMMATEPHSSPIRSTPLLYNIWDSRAEGVATGMEEWMMHAGLFEGRPRSRELIYVLIAQRAARAIAGLRLHSNEYTMEDAVAFASEWTPRGWMPEDSGTVWGEQYLYLHQPFYGASYLMGKHQIEDLMRERAHQLGDDFTFKRFMDEMEASGLIPVSLIRWEMTGMDDEIRTMTDGS